LNTNKVGTIHISASQGSNLYKNAKDVPFTTSFNPLLTGMNTPTPFVVTDSGIYASDRTHAYIAFNFTDNGQTGSP
jgi:hypothetical protein